MKRFACLAALGVFYIANVTAAPPRPMCCHGCNSYSCTPEQCGKMCKLGPKCHNCWKKDCTANH